MNIIGQRVIEFLKADSTLTTALGAATNIFAMGVQDRKDKYLVVSTEPGKDGNNIPTQEGTFTVEIVVSRKLANAHKVCIDIAKRVDDLLNKSETALSNGSWKVIHCIRVDSTGLLTDDEPQEFYFNLEYEYILAEAS